MTSHDYITIHADANTVQPEQGVGIAYCIVYTKTVQWYRVRPTRILQSISFGLLRDNLPPSSVRRVEAKR